MARREAIAQSERIVAAGSWVPLARAAKVARAWNGLAAAMDAAGIQRDRDPEPQAAVEWAERTWAISPAERMIQAKPWLADPELRDVGSSHPPARDAGVVRREARVGPHRPRVRAKRSVVPADKRLQLAAVLTARVERAAVDPAPVPDEPPAGINVLAESLMKELTLEAHLGEKIGLDPAVLASENEARGHESTVLHPINDSPLQGRPAPGRSSGRSR